MARAPSTSVAKANPKSTALVSIEDEMAAEVAALSSRLQAPSGDRVTLTKTGSFKLPDGSEGDSLNVVIVDFVATNSYYDKPYVKGENQAPACFAIGAANNNDLVPSDASPAKQAETCAECWANQWDSATTGKGKACKNNRLLAITAPGDEDAALMLLKVPTTSMKGFDSYVDSVARAYRRPVRAVTTEITSNSSIDWENCSFGSPEPLPQDQLLRVHARKQEAMDRLMVEPDCSTYTPPVAKGKAAGKAPVSRRA